uniref:D-2-hydroxyglutarate dehydrogenase YdiJ n=1 Tax=Dongshaea marina TaxID=2047966 RepID=UPI000D3EDA12|nr:FAD-binding and (Fe-S)-binding domain-containing protein [Dongshaea marina]
MSTDNSVYQCLCQGVLYPVDRKDLALLMTLASRATYRSITFSARGGGTGTNGQSLSPGVIVDLSRHMNRILEINTEEGWVRVEAGIVKDRLNVELKPHGLFFSPELSTSNRATIGGMISTDASGQGSLVYGKTSDHVLELGCVLADGSLLETSLMDREALSVLEGQPGRLAELCSELTRIVSSHQELIAEHFPKLNRFLTGYDLRHLYRAESGTLDISRLICGAEGTLAMVAEAKLNLTAVPKYRTLLCIRYRDFESALRHAPALLECQALSVETMDSLVLELARKDSGWAKVADYLGVENDLAFAGLNMVEFAGSDLKEQQRRLDGLITLLDQAETSQQAGVLGYQRCDLAEAISAIYGMRKKAVGLLGKHAGAAKPVPFVEDTAVPPEKLCDFILEFRKLLDSHGLDYGMFGHVDAGVLHVRPALDLCDPSQQQVLRTISDQVMALTRKYRGVLWGEHGRGYRSEYGIHYFGETLYRELRRIKSLFDPLNRLNPGKICTPLDSEAELVAVDGVMRAEFDRQIPLAVRESFSEALDCNGNGLCFNFEPGALMCPSMRARGDRRHSPKGRAALMREWLRTLSEQGYQPLINEQWLETRSGLHLGALFGRLKAAWGKRRGDYDFSHEILEAMQGCLACKACAGQCPVGVDIAELRSRFLNLYYSRYPRPLGDLGVRFLESINLWLCRAPDMSNWLQGQPWMQSMVRRLSGMVDLPELSSPPLPVLAHQQGFGIADINQLEQLDEAERKSLVVVVQDPFTSSYEAPVVRDLLALIERLGKTPLLLPFIGNGKALHIRGMLGPFKQTALRCAEMLNRLHRLGIPMLGVDPALVLCFRDEYQKALGDARGAFEVLMAQEWLIKNSEKLPKQVTSQIYYLFSHCTERSLCPESETQWQKLFKLTGANLLPQSVSCCGMAGLYGHQQAQKGYSETIYQQSWQPKLSELDPKLCLATGYSCRSQVKRFDTLRLKHPLQALLELYP